MYQYMQHSVLLDVFPQVSIEAQPAMAENVRYPDTLMRLFHLVSPAIYQKNPPLHLTPPHQPAIFTIVLRWKTI